MTLREAYETIVEWSSTWGDHSVMQLCRGRDEAHGTWVDGMLYDPWALVKALRDFDNDKDEWGILLLNKENSQIWRERIREDLEEEEEQE